MDQQQYRYDPYTGQPLRNPNPASRTWLGNGYPQQDQPQRPATQPQQTAPQSGVIFRPVASFDEAKAVPTDFSGALTIMPDWAHGYIYAKALADDGSPVFRAYRYEPPAPAAEAAPVPAVAYAPLEDVQALREEIAAIRAELASTKPAAKEPAGKSGKVDKT